MSQSAEPSHDILWRLIKDIKFCMFTTRHTHGRLHSRPVTTQNHSMDNESVLWFFMSRKSDPIADLTQDPQVNLGYADPSSNSYVSASGHAEVVEDLAKKKELWSMFAKAWFPGGSEDADLALVRVTVSHAHYWDAQSSKIVQLYQLAKAAITGDPPTNLGESGEVLMPVAASAPSPTPGPVKAYALR